MQGCVLLYCPSRPLAADTQARDSKVEEVCVCVFVSSHLAVDETVCVGQYYSDAQAYQSSGLKQTKTN